MAQVVDLRKEIEDHNHRWYAVSVTAGQEDLVVEYLNERVKKQEMETEITDYLNPVYNEVLFKNNKKVVKQRKIYPGYIFVRCKMNEKIWFIIRNTPGVRLIVGAEIRPVPLTDREYEDLLKFINEKNARAEHSVPFLEGDIVTLNDGDFNGMKGAVKEIDPMKGTLTVLVEILGRNTPVTVAFDKVERS
jgi:transcription termination/antitermination protein NusG